MNAWTNVTVIFEVMAKEVQLNTLYQYQVAMIAARKYVGVFRFNTV